MILRVGEKFNFMSTTSWMCLNRLEHSLSTIQITTGTLVELDLFSDFKWRWANITCSPGNLVWVTSLLSSGGTLLEAEEMLFSIDLPASTEQKGDTLTDINLSLWYFDNYAFLSNIYILWIHIFILRLHSAHGDLKQSTALSKIMHLYSFLCVI